MNTIRSVGYGWGILVVAGAGSYYFAKKSINADREERAHAEEKRRQNQERLRAQEAVRREAAMTQSGSPKGKVTTLPAQRDHPSPSRETSADPAAVPHTETMPPKKVYEAQEPYRSRKGDRFS